MSYLEIKEIIEKGCPLRIEVFEGHSKSPHTVKHYKNFMDGVRVPRGFITMEVSCIVNDFGAWVDFPTPTRLVRIFLLGNQEVFEKLYLDDNGNILTRFVFTKEG